MVPRPIASVSTVSPDGKVFNVAPYSFFGLMCHDPPTLVFCTTASGTRAGGPKDTLINARTNGECVVNMISECFVESANECCGEYGPEVDEFVVSGLSRTPTALPKGTPAVKEASVSFECKVTECRELHKRDGAVGGTMVLCEITRMNVHPSVLRYTPTGSPYVDLAALRPISRLGANDYGRTPLEGVFSIPRPAVNGYDREKKLA